jgi:P-type E1-E2 ATPase
VEAETLLPGDIISLRLGDTIPVDGTIVNGSALINEATLTGESLPITKIITEKVLAGTIVENGEVSVRVDKAGEETRLPAIIRLIETAENDPGELLRASHKFSHIMVPISLGLAGAAFLFTGNLLQAMAVLIITLSMCPATLHFRGGQFRNEQGCPGRDPDQRRSFRGDCRHGQCPGFGQNRNTYGSKLKNYNGFTPGQEI